jgi:hypothetical protein
MFRAGPNHIHPSQDGEISYILGQGFRLFEEGQEKALINPNAGLPAVGTIFEDVLTTTTSTSDVVMSGMTVIPEAGTYMVFFSGDLSHSANRGEIYVSLYASRYLVKGTTRYHLHPRWASYSFCTFAVLSVNGAQPIEGRWRVVSGVGTNYSRQMILMRISKKLLNIGLSTMMSSVSSY